MDPSDKSLAAFGGSEEQDDALGQRCEDVIDPAFEAFRDNIAEAQGFERAIHQLYEATNSL